MNICINTKEGYNRKEFSFFRLIGNNEDALTFALGYLFFVNRSFLIKILKECKVLKSLQGKNYEKVFKDYYVKLQDRKDISIGGRKDIVIETSDNNYRIVIEAKIGSGIPNIDQVTKYTLTQKDSKLIDYEFIKKEWGSFQKKYLIVLTNENVSIEKYKLIQDLIHKENINIIISVFNWYDVIEVVNNWKEENVIRNNKSIEFLFFLNELKKFMKGVYKMKHFQEEVLCRHVLKDSTYQIFKGNEDIGFYFDGKSNRTYKSSLFFAGCYGPSRSKIRTGEYIRRIDKFEEMTIEEILNHDKMKSQFEIQQKLGKDSIDPKSILKVFTLGKGFLSPKKSK
ncbi:MAG: hypothetical protein IPJ45_09380 [Ignavibacteria bacterium]|nr:hypothetical protein [Ignavibacteria bacterium]